MRESNTLAGNFTALLNRAFQPNEPFYENEDFDEDDGEENENSGSD